MKQVSFLVIGTLMCSAGAAVAAPIEINGQFNTTSLITEGSAPSVNVQLGDLFNTSIFVDDSAFDADALLSANDDQEFQFFSIEANPRPNQLVEIPIRQNPGSIGFYPNLASFTQQVRTDENGQDVVLSDTSNSGTSAFAGNDFILNESFASSASNLMASNGLQFGDSVDFIEFTSAGFFDDVPTEFGNASASGFIAFADDNWFERSAENGATASQMLAEATILGYVDFRRMGIDINPGGVTAVGLLNGPVLLNEFDETAGTEANPVLPTVITENGFEFRIPEDVIVENETIFFDPVISVGYTYEVSNMDFASVTAPTIGAVNDPDGYELVVNGNSYAIASGEEIVFADLGLTGITKFVLQGISTDLMLDPTDATAFITGLSFTNITGPLVLTQTPITVDTGTVNVVPLPAGGVLLVGGFALLAGLRHRKA